MGIWDNLEKVNCGDIWLVSRAVVDSESGQSEKVTEMSWQVMRSLADTLNFTSLPLT